MDIDFPPFDFLQMTVVISAVVIAYTIKGLSGFGAGLIAIPILSLVLPVTLAVPAVSLLSYSANLTQSYRLKHDTFWSDILPLIPFCLLGVVSALWLLSNVNSQQLSLAMGLFVIAYGLYSLLPMRQLSGRRIWAIPFGAVGGFIGGLFGSSGFVYVIYLKLRPLNKAQFRASVAMALTLDGTLRMSGYIVSGFFTTHVLVLVCFLFPILLLSMRLGNLIHLNINPSRFNQVISILLTATGAVLVYKSM